MTAARDSTMTLVHRALAVRLEKEAKRHGLPDGWATVLIAASTSIKMLADAIDADLAARESLASRKVAVPDGWIFYYADDEGTPYAHYCATRDDIYSQVGVWMCGEQDGGVLSDFGDDMLDGVTETLLAKGAFHPEGDPPCFLRKAMLASQDEVK